MQAKANCHAAQQVISQGFSSTFFQKDATAWLQWRHSCSWLHINPDLQGTEDPIPFLQIFVDSVRAGFLSATWNPIKKRSVKQYLHSIHQIFGSVGAGDQ